MRQVPKSVSSMPYLIIGNGRLAKHIIHYFDLLNVNYSQWYRSSSTQLSAFNLDNLKILLLINDDEIESFICHNNLQKLQNCFLIHCSGSLATNYAIGVHPLMTFSEKLYDLDTYKSIPFLVDSDEAEFSEIFPELNNPNYSIPFEKKTLYHAWCSMAGNFTSILWMNLFKVFEKEFNLNKSVAEPYMNQIIKNLQNERDPLTGPLKRGDINTINKHLEELRDHPFGDIYIAFTNAYKKMKLETK